MASEREIIREFLVSLGFQVDETGVRRFLTNLTGICKLATGAGAAVAGVAVAAEAMVQVFASQMEKLYYISRRTKSSVENIQGLEYGAKQIGIQADVATGALESMSMALRLNPGLTALLNNLGVRTEGRDRVQVLYDLVKQLNKMPFYIGAQFAEMFGIDPNTLLMIEQGLGQMQKAASERIRMNRAMGVDPNAAAAASREYMNRLRHIWAEIGVMSDKLAITMLPYFQKFTDWVDKSLVALSKFKMTDIDLGSWHKQLRDIITDLKDLYALMSSDDPNRWSAFFWLIKNEGKSIAHAFLDITDAMVLFASGKFSEAGKKFGSGLDYLLNQTEKSEAEKKVDQMLGGPEAGTNRYQALSTPGFMGGPPLGGPSMLAKALYVLSTQLGGTALEVQRDAARVSGGPIQFHQETNINVSGAGSPNAVGKAVAGEQGRVNADLTRNLVGAVR